jgi:oligopeptide/dipeptide ABC transporter ATP-binding protein
MSAVSNSRLLEIKGLRVGFRSADGDVAVVHDVGFTLARGETLALVGESGSGKSLTALSIADLLPRGAYRQADRIRLGETELTALSKREMRAVRGGRIGMVFQDTLSALNPAFTVGRQLTDAIRAHRSMRTSAARRRAAELLDLVGIAEPTARLRSFPHELSGGQRQRVAIALALGCEPELLIADEPTTALDVTVQAQVIALLARLKEEIGIAILFISHNLDLVAEICDRVAVMYAGRIVETDHVRSIFERPRHPYTQRLLDCIPRLDDGAGALRTIPGEPPPFGHVPTGCAFRPRCADAKDVCMQMPPTVARGDGHVTCWLAS